MPQAHEFIVPNMSVDRFLLMTCFARAVETGSFSAVARELGIGQPNVSRHVAALEQHLGTRLMHRSTRKLTLTPEGERYYAEVRRVLDAVTEAESVARGESDPSGLLRVTCPTSLGRVHLLPRMRTLLERYPQLTLDLQISDRFADLVEEGVDLAIRIGPLKDSSLRARRIGFSDRVCVASTEYLAHHGVPREPQDLLRHNCVVYTLFSSGSSWKFRDCDIAVSGRIRVNTTDGIHSAILDGFGIGYGPLWLFEQDVLDGRVQLLLLDHLGPPAVVNIVYSAKRLLPSRATAFMDFIADEFSRVPAFSEGALLRVAKRSI